MANQFWDNDNDEISDFDLAQQEAGGYANEPPPPPRAQKAKSVPVSEDATAFELTEDETDVMYIAKLRLEQAGLYNMLINHDIFDGVQANPDAIAAVQKELKDYILERLQILLGIRKEKEESEIVVESQFTDAEVEFLKQLAYKGMKVASFPAMNTQNSLKPIDTTKQQAELKPMVPTKPIPEVSSPKKTTATPVKKEVPAKREKVHSKTLQERSVAKAINDKVGNTRALTDAEIEAIAREDIKNTNHKPFDQMTEAEKIAEVLRVNNKHAKTVSVEKTPIPDAAALAMRYQTAQIMNNSETSTKDQMTDLALALIRNQNGI